MMEYNVTQNRYKENFNFKVNYKSSVSIAIVSKLTNT